jgi:SpoIID/LytB domain protein
VPLPSGVHADALVTPSRREAARLAAQALAAVLLAPAVARAQDRVVTEADLVQASAGRQVRLGSPATGRVEVLPIEVYVARVLAGEGEPNAAPAAHQALAVAIRTFARANQARHADDGFELCDETHCQVLRASTPASRAAAMATAGAVLLYEGAPAELFYSASCGGRSERAGDVWSANFPYLVSREDDVHEGDQPWIVDIPLSDLQRSLSRAGFEGTLRGLRVTGRTESGRVARLEPVGMRPEEIGGDDFRLAVGSTTVRSTAFSIAVAGNGIRFTGQGYGHGVGMCVIGAGRRAARGESFRAILEQYYPGLEMVSLDGGLLEAPREAAVAAPIPAAGTPGGGDVQALTDTARTAVAAALGVAPAGALTATSHASLDAFWVATGQPWWRGAVVRGGVVHLAPSPVLEQRGGVDLAVHAAAASALLEETLTGRPAWVCVGASRHYARVALGRPAAPGAAGACPADAELTLAVSAAALADAEARAEGCFARALEAAGGDWRAVR